MSNLGAVIVLAWPSVGIVFHIFNCCRMKTWCGTGIWREPSTYVMFFPAMLLGPLMLIVEMLEPSNRS